MFILVFLKLAQIEYIPVSTIKRKRTHFEHFPVSYIKEDYIRCQILGLSKKKPFGRTWQSFSHIRHILLFKNYEKICRFSSFLTTSWKYANMLESLIILFWKQGKNGLHGILYTVTFSRWYMCIFIRFKHLLNLWANVERNCFFLFNIY